MPRLHLTGSTARPWCHHGRTHARGYIVTPCGAVLTGPALARHLDGTKLDAELPRLPGEYAVVQEDAGGLTAAVDRIRSMPLFYGHARSGAPCLSDDARWVAAHLGARLDTPAAAAELLLASCTAGPTTLCSTVRQVQAGEIVRLDRAAVYPARYFAYGNGAPLETTEEEQVREGARGLEAAFEDFLRTVAGRPVVVPLSGGMDSRLIAALLVKGGRTDAGCFTYGRSSSFEVRASRRVARHLGLRWHFVPYSAGRWRRWWQSEAFQQFRRAAPGLSTIEHEQDWPAVQVLAQQGLVPEGAVFVPGHAGDFLGGSHLPPKPEPFEADPVAWVWQRYYTEWPAEGLTAALQDTLHRRIAVQLEGAADPVEAFTRFGWQERQAKVIANSVRVYEHFAHDWRLPFWTHPDVLAFWGRVPVPLRRGRRLYLRVLHHLLGDVFDLPSTLRYAPPPLVRRLRRGTDRDLRRYGIWLGRQPEAAALRRRLSDLLADHPAAMAHPVVGPVVAQVTRPWASLPPQRAPINGLLALSQLDLLCREVG